VGTLLLGLTGLALWTLTRANGTGLVLLSVVGLGMAMRGYLPVIQSHLMDILPPGGRGRGFGFARALYFALGSLGPAGVGVAAERAGFEAAFLGLALLVALAALGFSRQGRFRRRTAKTKRKRSP